MALSYSTGLVNLVMSPTGMSLGAALSGCVIDIYSGVRPEKASHAVPAGSVLLGTVTKNGVLPAGNPVSYALHFSEPTMNGTIDRSELENWVCTAIAGGLAGWFRLRSATQDGRSDSSVEIRIDGTIGVSGDAVISSSEILAGGAYTFNRFRLTWPV